MVLVVGVFTDKMFYPDRDLVTMVTVRVITKRVFLDFPVEPRDLCGDVPVCLEPSSQVILGGCTL